MKQIGLKLGVIAAGVTFLNVSGAEGIPFGDMKLYPFVESKLVWDDNIFRSDRNEFDDILFVLHPGIGVKTRRGDVTFSGSYDVEVGRYDESDRDDYEYHTLQAGAAFEGNRSFLRLDTLYYDGSDPRGTGASEGNTGAFIINEPNEWHSWSLDASAGFAGRNGKVRGELRAGVLDKQYDNNRQFTDFLDRGETSAGTTLYYKLAPKTSLLGEVNYTDIEYDKTVIGSSLDSEEWYYYVGVTWDATAKTTGTIKVGGVDKSFTAPDRGDFNGGSWSVQVDWQPRSYSALSFATSRETNETNGTGDFILTKDVSVSWNHAWNNKFKTNVNFLVANDEFGRSQREDDRVLYGISADYGLRRWLTFQAGYEFQSLDSNQDFDYDKNLFNLSALVEF